MTVDESIAFHTQIMDANSWINHPNASHDEIFSFLMTPLQSLSNECNLSATKQYRLHETCSSGVLADILRKYRKISVSFI